MKRNDGYVYESAAKAVKKLRQQLQFSHFIALTFQNRSQCTLSSFPIRISIVVISWMQGNKNL